MTFIKFNPDLMQAFIYNLTSYAEEVNTARSKIHQSSDDNDHPVPSVDDATRTLPAMPRMTSSTKIAFLDANLNDGILTPTMADAISSLTVLINNLEARRKEIIKLNSNGITASDGTMTYYLPDGIEDTVSNVHAYNTQAAATATADAEALSQAVDINNKGGIAQDGRSIIQIIDNMSANQDNPIYAAAFVNKYGASGTITLASTLQSKYSAGRYTAPLNEENLSLSGHLVAAASQTWDTTKSQQMAQDIASTYNKPNMQTQLGLFNSVMETQNVLFGKNFLVELADAMDEVPWQKVTVSPGTRTGRVATPDPLEGILVAMENVPDAALEYLVRDPANEDINGMTDRITKILKRHEVGDNAWTDRWAKILADASNHSLETVDAEHPASQEAIRAAIAVSTGVTWLSKADELSTNARDNVTTLLVNTAWSVDEAAGRGDEYAHPFESDPAGGDPTLTGLTVQPQYNRSALAKLIGRISDDKDDTNFNAVSQAVGILNENRLAHAAAQASQGHNDYLPSAMEKTSAAQGYLISSAQAAVESNAKDRDERNKSIIDMVMGMTSFIPGLGEEASEFLKNGYDYTQSRVSDIAKDSLTESFSNNLAIAMARNATDAGHQNQIVQAGLLYNMAAGGVLSSDQMAQLQQRVPGIFSDGKLDPSQLSANTENLNDVITSPAGVLTAEQQGWLRSAGDAYTKGYNNGKRK